MIVKVCGMRDPENIRQVERTGADWMGFIFYPRSPRYVAERPAYLPQRMRRVGVFVNAEEADIRRHIADYGLEAVQLHGQERPELCAALRKGSTTVIKAFRLKTAAEAAATADYEGAADYFLFDTPTEAFGGSGHRFDWSLLDHYRGKTPFLLSGGIGPDSLDALSRFHHPCWAGIDLNSGFETAPARKDAEQLTLFIELFNQLSV